MNMAIPIRNLTTVCVYLNGIILLVFGDCDFWLSIVVDILWPVGSWCVVFFPSFIRSGDLIMLCRFF
jgi:hypothetical protein